MEKSAALFAPHLSIGIAEHEADSGEEVTLARAVAPNDYVVLWREGLNHCLVLVAVKAISLDFKDIARSRCTS